MTFTHYLALAAAGGSLCLLSACVTEVDTSPTAAVNACADADPGPEMDACIMKVMDSEPTQDELEEAEPLEPSEPLEVIAPSGQPNPLEDSGPLEE